MQAVRIYEMPECKMVSSGVGMFGEEKFERFNQWLSAQERGMFPRDFLFWDKTGFHWLYMYSEGLEIPEEFHIIDYPGGLYAVATDIDRKTDIDTMKAQVDSFLQENGFERDVLRSELGNIITPPSAQEVMGYSQMDYYAPIKIKG